MDPSFLTPAQLAVRWNMSTVTLGLWRWNGLGPEFHKLGGRVCYSLKDVLEFENSRRCRSTTEYPLNRSDQWKTNKKSPLKYIHIVKKKG